MARVNSSYYAEAVSELIDSVPALIWYCKNPDTYLKTVFEFALQDFEKEFRELMESK